MNEQNKINKYKKKYFALKKNMENNQKKIEGGQKQIGGESSTRTLNLKLLKKYKEGTVIDALIRPLIPTPDKEKNILTIEDISEIGKKMAKIGHEYEINSLSLNADQYEYVTDKDIATMDKVIEIVNAYIYQKVKSTLEDEGGIENIATKVLETFKNGIHRFVNNKESVKKELKKLFEYISDDRNIHSYISYITNKQFLINLFLDDYLYQLYNQDDQGDIDAYMKAFIMAKKLFNYDICKIQIDKADIHTISKRNPFGSLDTFPRMLNHILFFFFKDREEIVVGDYCFVIVHLSTETTGRDKPPYGCLLVFKQKNDAQAGAQAGTTHPSAGTSEAAQQQQTKAYQAQQLAETAQQQQ